MSRQKTKQTVPEKNGLHDHTRISTAILLLLLMSLVFACTIPTMPVFETHAVPTIKLPQNKTASVTKPPAGATQETTSTAAVPEVVFQNTPFKTPAQPITAENAHQLIELAQWENGIARSMSWSGNGESIFVASTQGVQSYERTGVSEISGITPTDFQKFPHPLSCLGVSKQEKLLAVGTETGEIFLWKEDEAASMQVLSGYGLPVTALAFSPDGSLLASSGWDGRTLIWETNSGEIIRTLDNNVPIETLTFSDDSKLLYTYQPDQGLQTWEVLSGNVISTVYPGKGSAGGTPSVAFSADGTRFAIETGTGVRIYRAEDGYTVQLLEGFEETVQEVALSSDGALAAVSMRQSIQIYRADDGTLLQEMNFNAPIGNSRSLLFSPDNQLLAHLGEQLTIWDLSGISLQTEISLKQRIDEAALSPEGEMLIGWRKEELSASVWDLSLGKTIGTLGEHLTPITGASFSEDRSLIATAADMVYLWDAETFTLLQQFEASAPGESYRVRVFHAESGLTTYETIQDRVPLSSVAFSPTGEILAGGTLDGQLYFWQVPTGKQIAIARAPENSTDTDSEIHVDEISVDELIFSEDGKYIVATNRRGMIDIWLLPEVSENIDFVPAHQQAITIPDEDREQGIPNLGHRLCRVMVDADKNELFAAWGVFSIQFDLTNARIQKMQPALCGFIEGVMEVDDHLTLPLPSGDLNLQIKESASTETDAVYKVPLSEKIIIQTRGATGTELQFWAFESGFDFRQQTIQVSNQHFPDTYAQEPRFSLDGSQIRWLWRDGRLRTTQSLSGQSHLSKINWVFEPETFAVAPNQLSAAASSRQGELFMLMDAAPQTGETMPEPRLIEKYAPDRINCLAFSTDGQYLAVGLDNQRMQIWRIEGMEVFSELEISGQPELISFSPMDNLIIVHTHEGMALYELQGSELRFIKLIAGNKAAFSADQQLLGVSSGAPGSRIVTLWEIKPGTDGFELEPYQILAVGERGMGSLSFSADNSLLAVSGRELTIWETSTGILLTGLPNQAPHGEIKFLSDDSVLMLASSDGSVHLYGIP